MGSFHLGEVDSFKEHGRRGEWDWVELDGFSFDASSWLQLGCMNRCSKQVIYYYFSHPNDSSHPLKSISRFRKGVKIECQH